MLFLSVFALVALTFMVLFTMGAKRFKAAKARRIEASFYKLYRGDNEPDDIRQLSRNFKNLFEAPVLFYLAILLTLVLKIESGTLLILAWTYVLLRYLHTWIHCTSNKVLWRFRVYLLSCMVLLTYWFLLLFKVF